MHELQPILQATGALHIIERYVRGSAADIVM